jgi:hypothetical protein
VVVHRRSVLDITGLQEVGMLSSRRSAHFADEIYRHPVAPIRSGHTAAMNQLIDTPPRHEKPRAASQFRGRF